MPEVGREMKLWRYEVRGGEGTQKKKRIRAIQTREVAERNGNLFATTAMTGVGGRSIS